MRICQRSKAWRKVLNAKACCALALVLTWGVTESFASPSFYDTTAANASHWLVTADISGVDYAAIPPLPTPSPFLTSGFKPAVALASRTDWIHSNLSGSTGTWTQFVFRQSLDLTGYDLSAASLSFQWAADDSGEGILSRGHWTPKYSVNGGSLINGSWPGGPTYSLGNLTVIAGSDLMAGPNTIDFYVQGNGTTDGFSLMNVSLTGVNPVPEPATCAMLLAGLGLLGFATRRRNDA
jgi:hypothetical protein